MSKPCREVLMTMMDWYNCPDEFKKILADELDKTNPN